MKRLVSIVFLIFVILSITSGQLSALPDGRAERDVKEVDRRIREAIRLRNTAVLEDNIADDFLLIDSSGVVLNKAQFVNGIRTIDGEEVPTEIDEAQVRVYGDVAVLTHRISSVDSLIIGDFSGQWRKTGVFVKRQGRWRLVSSQETLIQRRRAFLRGDVFSPSARHNNGMHLTAIQHPSHSKLGWI